MQLASMHPEDIKAGIRKRFGSVAAFERENDLPEKSVTDFLRGRLSARVIQAIEEALAKPTPQASQSEVSDSSKGETNVHRLISTAR